MKVQQTRVERLNEQPIASDGKAVIYWMQKDQRAHDNWALMRAIEHANELKLPVVVAFFVWELKHNAYARHYDFMLRGLAETAQVLHDHGIGYVLRHEAPVKGITKLANELDAAVVVTDQVYLRLGKARREKAAAALPVLLEAVDANVIVPTAVLADKQLYAAYIARPKLHKNFDEYLTDYPQLRVTHRWSGKLNGLDDQAVDVVLAQLNLDNSVPAVPTEGPAARIPGAKAAHAILDNFIGNGIERYQDSRNDPVANSTSQLSAYLHYGQISSQRVAFELLNSPKYGSHKEAVDGYIDELVTWRELSTNYCKFNSNYDSSKGLPDWAQETLNQHTNDDRAYTYSRKELEEGKTHDELWNAAQLEMVRSGRMHGYLRMYWGKKILEWTQDPEQAIKWAIYLNDKYELDGREANGYTGILWAVGGLHDRPWFEREIFGKIRYMSYNGAKGKFDIKAYVDWVDRL